MLKRTVAAIIALALAFCLVACADDSGSTDKNGNTAKDALEKAFEAFKTLDSAGIAQYYTQDSQAEFSELEQMDESAKRFTELVYEKASYKIIETDKASTDTVKSYKIEVTSTDMATAALRAISNYPNIYEMSDEEGLAAWAEILSDETLLTTNPTAVLVMLQDDEWRVDANEHFLKAIMGESEEETE